MSDDIQKPAEEVVNNADKEIIEKAIAEKTEAEKPEVEKTESIEAAKNTKLQHEVQLMTIEEWYNN